MMVIKEYLYSEYFGEDDNEYYVSIYDKNEKSIVGFEAFTIPIEMESFEELTKNTTDQIIIDLLLLLEIYKTDSVDSEKLHKYFKSFGSYSKFDLLYISDLLIYTDNYSINDCLDTFMDQLNKDLLNIKWRPHCSMVVLNPMFVNNENDFFKIGFKRLFEGYNFLYKSNFVDDENFITFT